MLTDNAGLVWAGDGNSTIKVLKPTLNTGAVALIKSIPTCPSGSDGCGTGGKFRADELSYDAVDNRILIAYDADNFLTFVHVDDAKPTNSAVVGHFFYADHTIGAAASLPGRATTGNGLEQSVYVPQTRLFYQAVRGNTDTGAVGFIDVFDPTTMRLVDTFPVPGYGQLHKIVEGVGGADEIWFNPGDTNFYLGIRTSKLGVVNAADDYVVSIISGHGGHLVAANAGNNHTFDPNRNGTGIDVFVSSGSS